MNETSENAQNPSRRPSRGWMALFAVVAVAAVLPLIVVLATNAEPPPPAAASAPPPPSARQAAAAGPAAAGAQDAPVPVAAGTPFPKLGVLAAVNIQGGPQAAEFIDVDLDKFMQDKVLVLFYWVAGDDNSEENLKAMAAWAREQPQVTLVSVVPPRGQSARQVAERATALGLDVPVLWDGTYRIQRTLAAASAPFIAVVDSGGVVRLLGAAGLKHRIKGDTTLASYLGQGLGGKMETVTEVSRYYPVTEFIDSPYMDFSLSQVPGGEMVRFSEHVGEGKLTLLVFWSPDCGHCKVELPEINAFYKNNRDVLDILSVVKLPDDGMRQRTADFIRVHDLQFPTLGDRAFKVFDQYRVRTTPTTVVVTPDGKIATVILGSDAKLEDQLKPLLAELKKAAHSGA